MKKRNFVKSSSNSNRYSTKNTIKANLHIINDLSEGEGHASADDHLINLVQHILNQLDLVSNLNSEQCVTNNSIFYLSKFTHLSMKFSKVDSDHKGKPIR